MTRRVLVLTSDTGAGHRSVSAALIEAAGERPERDLELTVFDPLALPPRHLAGRDGGGRAAVDRLAGLYAPAIVRAPWFWGWVYKASDNRVAVALCLAVLGSAVAARIAGAVERVAPDAVVSVHPLVNHALVRARRRSRRPRLPLLAVLTDLVDVHHFWAAAGVDQFVASTDVAAGRLHDLGIAPQKIATFGIPLKTAFGRLARSTREMRRALGLNPEVPAVLLMGGGDGAGHLVETARAIDALARRSTCAVQLVVLAGRNERARRRLEQCAWTAPVRVHGFVANIAEYMTAADVIVTKPGSVTIAEALTLGRPLLLGRPLPGQEEGNVAYVVNAGAGLAYRSPAAAAEATAWLLGEPATAWEMGQRAARLGHPHATERTLDLLQSLLLRAEATQLEGETRWTR